MVHLVDMMVPATLSVDWFNCLDFFFICVFLSLFFFWMGDLKCQYLMAAALFLVGILFRFLGDYILDFGFSLCCYDDSTEVNSALSSNSKESNPTGLTVHG